MRMPSDFGGHPIYLLTFFQFWQRDKWQESLLRIGRIITLREGIVVSRPFFGMGLVNHLLYGNELVGISAWMRVEVRILKRSLYPFKVLFG